jgi:hypothetical protein
MKTENGKDSLIQTVKRYLEREPYRKESLPQTIVTEGVRPDEDYWYVPVSTPREAESVFDYYNYLAKIEEAILEQENQHVILVPCLDSEEITADREESTV